MATTGVGFAAPLNIGITDEHLSNNPKFSTLLRDLGKRLSSEQDNKASEIKTAEIVYRKVKNGYFEQLLFYTSLLDIFIKNGTKEVKSFLPEEQVLRDVHTRLACAEATSFLVACSQDCPDQDIFTELKLELQAQDKPNYTHEDVKKAIASKIEKWLSDKENMVLQCYFQKDNIPVSSVSRLSVLLEKDMKISKLERQKLRSEQMVNERLLAKYSEALLNATSLLIKILETIDLELQVNYNEAVVETMSIKSQALKLKAKSILLQIQKETYTPDATAALKCLKSALDEKELSMERKLLDKSSALSSYQKLGDSFEELAEEARRLNQDIEMHSWSLDTGNFEL